jgi:hypothetical protein
MKKNRVLALVIFLVIGLAFLSCLNPAGLISYPYTEYELEYMGMKSGLTSSSSNQAFETALDEVIETYFANTPPSSDEVVIDGVTYESTNVVEATGGIPKVVWDHYWEKLGSYTYHIGSCFLFFHLEIPLKGATGTVYVLYTIVKSTATGGDVRYFAYRGNLIPK